MHLKGDFKGEQGAPYLIVAEHGDDLTMMDFSEARVGVAGRLGGKPYTDTDGCEAYVMTDRGIYRPGGTCHLTALVRDRDYEALHGFPVELLVIQPDGRTLQSKTRMLSDFGRASLDVTFPVFAMTGRYRLQARIPGSDTPLGECTIQVETFVPPQIAVDLNCDKTAVLDERGRFPVKLQARHLFGRPAANLPVSVRAEFSATPFIPSDPTWKHYRFGDNERSFSRRDKKVWTGRLDDDGQAGIMVPVELGWRPPAAINAVIGATVTESGGRAVSDYTSRTIHLYPFYLGISPARIRPPVGTPTAFSIVALSPNEELHSGTKHVNLRVSRISRSYCLVKNSSGTWSYQSERREEVITRETLQLTNGQGRCTVTPPAAGQYLLTLTDSGSQPRVSASITFHASAGSDSADTWSMDYPDRIELQPDKDTYNPGDTARILVKAPFAGRGLISLETDRVLDYQIRVFTNNTAEIMVSIPTNAPSTVYAAVSILRPLQKGTDIGAHRAVGIVPLAVTRPHRQLAVEIESPGLVRPKSTLESRIRVLDSDGKPVSTEIVVAAVDEGICMLTNFKLPDPLKAFRAQRRLGVTLYDLYSLLMPELDSLLRGGASDPGGDVGGALRRRLNPIRARRFKPTALWSGILHTDTNGLAKASFDVPEFTGTLRLMAIAVGETQTGTAQADVIVKRPLIVRSSLPRFLAPGDSCNMSLQVFNETGSNQTVTCELDCSGPITSPDSVPTFELADGESHAFNITLQANASVGCATIKTRVTAGEESFEEAVELAVRPASARQRSGGFMLIKEGEHRSLSLADGWIPGTGISTIKASGLPLTALSGGLNYLLRYPYGCLEQTTSAAFPLLYLADLVEQVAPGSITRGDCAHYVQAGILRILSMQVPNGGFAYWPHSRKEYGWGSLYAIHFLVEAERAGYDVPDARLNAALTYTAGLLASNTKIPSDPTTREWADYMTKRSVACSVLATAGKPHHGWMERLRDIAADLDTAAVVNLAAAYTTTGRRDVAAELLKLPALDYEGTTITQTGNTLNSGTRNLATLLSAWLDINPESPMIPVLVDRLNRRQSRHGRWRNTQENAVALMALGRYAQVRNKQGKTFKATLASKSKTFTFDDQHPLHLSQDEITSGSIEISNAGPGPVYLHWESSGVPSAPNQNAGDLDQQLQVRRTILNADAKQVSPHDLQQGELYVIKVTVDTRGEYIDNLVVEDLLPAGLEVENARLKTSAILPWVRRKQTLQVRHMELRDDRVLLFANPLHGRHHYYYAVRAVTPGTFALPAIVAECMYDPAIRSHHGQGRITIK